MGFWRSSTLKSGKRKDQNTNQTHYALCKHHLTNISVKEIILHSSMGESSEISPLPRQKEKAQQSSAIQSSRWRNFLERRTTVLGSHSGVALTNVSACKALGFQRSSGPLQCQSRRLLHLTTADGDKFTQFEECPTKTRQGGLRNKIQSSLQQMWLNNFFEEWLAHQPNPLKNSGPLYLAIIPRPSTNVWYAKSRMGKHWIGQITKTVASCLLESCTK